MSEAEGAGAALQGAVLAALAAGELGGVYPGVPVQAAFPHLLVETGAERNWGHKSGAGRELRLAVTVKDKGERPERARTLLARAEAVMAEIGPALGGWRLVTLVFVSGRVLREGGNGWAARAEYRARMLES